MISFIFSIVVVIVLYNIVKNFPYWPSVIAYTICSLILSAINGQFDHIILSVIISFIIGLVYVKIYSKVIDFCDNFLYSVFIMGVIEFLATALIYGLIDLIF